MALLVKSSRVMPPMAQRKWLLDLSRVHRKAIGCDLQTAQDGWPLGMPLRGKLEPGLWEIRSPMARGIAQVLIKVEDVVIVLLKGSAARLC
jgi:hypothetical protein